MAYIIDSPEQLANDLGKMPTWRKKLNEFFAKVHFIHYPDGVKCNIEPVDSIASLFIKANKNPRMSVGFIILDRGLEIWFHFQFDIISVGIRNSDIIGWKLITHNSLWYLMIVTHTNQSLGKPAISFLVKNQNLPHVKNFFTKYGFPELD